MECVCILAQLSASCPFSDIQFHKQFSKYMKDSKLEEGKMNDNPEREDDKTPLGVLSSVEFR